MYPRLRERAKSPEIYEEDPVRFDVMEHFGAFVTESSGHFSEYVPYYRKRPDLIEKYMRSGYRGASGFYPHGWPVWRREHDERVQAMLDGTEEIPMERSHEYGSDIVEAMVFDKPLVIYGNVLNTGLIDNLPNGCVEVPCLVDRNGVQPAYFGPLPEQLAALNRAHMAVHRLMVQALLERDKQAARYALMLDPLSAAVCSPAEISAMFDELWEAERPYLQEFE
jgi:alpha-galactosidase